MLALPWWIIILAVIIFIYLVIRLAHLSRRSRELHDELCKLEGADELEECQDVAGKTGDAEGM